MKKAHFVLLVLTFVISCIWTPPAKAKQALMIGGGPIGGTFNYLSSGIAGYVTEKVGVEVTSEGSGGSVDNVRRVDRRAVDFGIAYSGDVYLGREGQLAPDTNKYGNTRTMAYLYGAPAQLVVLKSAGIASAQQLAGKKVAVGNAGSGAALSAERFFKTMGIWEKMEPQFLGYAAAVSAFRDRKIDAFWVLVGYPNSSIMEAAA